MIFEHPPSRLRERRARPGLGHDNHRHGCYCTCGVT
jgi:hypothetical protein